MKKKLQFLDLFAGCGGLSLGFEYAGLELATAVELSPMAAETHFRNFHLRNQAWDDGLWRQVLASSDSGEGGKKTFAKQIEKGMVVGSVRDLLKDDESMAILQALDLDVVAGGPPCQGFSMAGRRNPNDKRNQLPLAFLDFVERLNPKAVVIENVAGINMAFASRGGVKSAFAQLHEELKEAGDGYRVQAIEANAKHFGVPQNRPRMILVGIREDIAKRKEIKVRDEPWRSVDAWQALKDPAGDPTSGLDLVPEVGSMVRKRRAGRLQPIESSANDALSDLLDEGYKEDVDYRKQKDHFYARKMRGRWDERCKEARNHNLRKHSEPVVERFELYRHFDKLELSNSVLGIPARAKDQHEARRKVEEELGDLKDDYLKATGGSFLKDGEQSLVDVVMRLATLKHTQRVVKGSDPAPTVVTLPDDYVHPSKERIMTVRELARLQSFPDWFEFRSKETTGGKKRKVEVPQYTQVGNAVPPLMAQAIGELLVRLLAEQLEEC